MPANAAPNGPEQPHVVTIIQARMGSRRLPHKVMLPLLGQPLLLRLVARVQAASLSGTVVVATTTADEDQAIVKLCQEHDIRCFRGDPEDCLDRHLQAGRHFAADVVVKIPSDCPLIDPAVIDRVIGAYLHAPGPVDYGSNLHPASYPDGNDVEVMSMAALERVWGEATRPFEREHTTPYFWENQDQFHLINVPWESGLDYSMSHRFTIDYAADYLFIKSIYEALYPQKPLFTLHDILHLLVLRPELRQINATYNGVNWYRHHLNELRTVSAAETRMEL